VTLAHAAATASPALLQPLPTFSSPPTHSTSNRSMMLAATQAKQPYPRVVNAMVQPWLCAAAFAAEFNLIFG